MSEVTLTREELQTEIDKLQTQIRSNEASNEPRNYGYMNAKHSREIAIRTLALERLDMDLSARDKAVRDAALDMAANEVMDMGWYRSSDDEVTWETQNAQIEYSFAAILALKSTPARFQEVPINQTATEQVLDLTARDAEVTRMALEMAANRADVIAGFQKNAQTDTDTSPEKVGNYHHGENVAIGIRAAILALAPLATGMKLVPVEPTPEMLKAAVEIALSHTVTNWPDYMAKLYRAMLTAVTVKP